MLPAVLSRTEVWRKAKDSSGHEHAADTGQFTSGGGGGAKPAGTSGTAGGHKERLASAHEAHQKAREEYRAARKEAYSHAAAQAKAADEKANAHVEKASEAMGGIAWDTSNDDEAPFNDLEESIGNYDPGETLANRYGQLQEIEEHAKAALEVEQQVADPKAEEYEAAVSEAHQGLSDFSNQAAILWQKAKAEKDPDKQAAFVAKANKRLEELGNPHRLQPDPQQGVVIAGSINPLVDKANAKLEASGNPHRLGVGRGGQVSREMDEDYVAEHGGISAEDAAENKKQLESIAGAAKQARKELRVASGHKKDMAAIKQGKLPGGKSFAEAWLKRTAVWRRKGWVTIGSSDEGEGGTHVFIGEGGKITAGPAHLVGHAPDAIPKAKPKNNLPAANKEGTPAKEQPPVPPATSEKPSAVEAAKPDPRSEKADAASDKAGAATDRAATEGTRAAHVAAMKAHDKAALDHSAAAEGIGVMATKYMLRKDPESVAQMEKLSALSNEHADKAQSHREASAREEAAARALPKAEKPKPANALPQREEPPPGFHDQPEEEPAAPKPVTPQEAAKKLAALPGWQGDKHTAKAPLKQVDDLPFDAAKLQGALDAGQGKKEDVPLSELHTDQPGVERQGVAAYLSNPTKPATSEETKSHGDRLVVVRSGGKLYLMDGNHRASAGVLRGMSHMPAYVVDLPAKP